MKIKNTNYRGMRDYLFIREFLACKNGFFYYFFPFILSGVLLVTDFVRDAFFLNLSVAAAVLFLIWQVRAMAKIKNILKLFLKIVFTIFIIALFIGGTFLYESYGNPFWTRISFFLTAKLTGVVFGFIYCFNFYKRFFLMYRKDVSMQLNENVRINAGKPGVGKTSHAVNDAIIIAKRFWNELQYDFFLKHSRREEIIKSNNKDKISELQEIEFSFNFYTMHSGIPCLWSNVPIEQDGHFSFVATIEHLKGKERLPLYSVVLFDEFGALVRAELGAISNKNRPYDISDMFRLGRHFLKWYVILCEQDYSNIYIDVRRVVGYNRIILSQQWVSKPVVLIVIFNFLKFIAIDLNKKKVHHWRNLACFLENFNTFIRSVGFRKYTYKNKGNVETGAVIVDEMETVRYAPSFLLAKYNDRSYRELYPCFFNKNLSAKVHNSLLINGLKKESKEYLNESTTVKDMENETFNSIIFQKILSEYLK